MSELNDKDIPASSPPEAIVSVSENVIGEIPLGSGTCMASDQVEASSAEGGQSCNAEDIMVEVLGTSVYVGGVCTSEGGARSTDEGGQGASAKVSAGEDRGLNSSVEGGGNSIIESSLQDTDVSSRKMSKSHKSGNEVQGSLGSSKLVEEERDQLSLTEVVAVVTREETVIVEEVSMEETGRVEDKFEVCDVAKDVEMETCVDGSVVVSSSSVETRVVRAKVGEEGITSSVEGENLKVELGASIGCGGEKDVFEVGGEAKDTEMETCVDGSVVVTNSSVETIVVRAKGGEQGAITDGEGEKLMVELGAITGHNGEKDTCVNNNQEPVANTDKVVENENAQKVENLGEAVTEPGDKNEVGGSLVGAPGKTLAGEGENLKVDLGDNTGHRGEKDAGVIIDQESLANTDKVGENDNAQKVEGLGGTVTESGDKNEDRGSSVSAPGETRTGEGENFKVVVGASTGHGGEKDAGVYNDQEPLANRNNVGEDENAQKVEGLGEAVTEAGVKNEVGVSSVGASGETLAIIAVEDFVESGKGLSVEAMEVDSKMADRGIEASNGLKTLNVAQNPEIDSEIEAMVVPSSATTEDLSGQIQLQVVNTAVAPTVCEEGLDSKIKLDKQSNVSIAGEVAVMDKGEPLRSQVSAMETDAVSEQDTSHPGDDQPLKTEEIVDSTENLGHVHMHSTPKCLLNEVAAGADLAEKKSEVVVSVYEDNKRVDTEVCTDSNVASGIARLESSTGEKMEVDNQNSDLQQVGSDGDYEKILVCDTEVQISAERDQPLESEEYLKKSVLDGVPPLCRDTMQEVEVQELHQGQEVLVEEQQEKGEIVDRISKNEHQEHVDDKSSYQPTQVVEAEVSASDGNVLSKPNVDMVSMTGTVQESTKIGVHIADSGEVDPMDSEEVLKPATEMSTSPKNDKKFGVYSAKEVASDITAPERCAANEAGLEGVTDADKVYLHGEQDYEVATEIPDTEQTPINEEKIAKWESLLPGTSPIVNFPSYELQPENDGVYSVSDLVWGKVKSHPWWPGQIFDFTDASEKAMKYQKKDCFLVAYFGDRTFAWNEASSLKPFRTYFSQMEKQCNSERFQNAINCALEEASRRVQLGLSCSCMPQDVYNKIKFQSVENAGINQESNRRDGSDECAYINSLEAVKLIEYVKALAKFPSGGRDRLELEIAKAQLLAFNRLKGHCCLPEFLFCEGLMESDAEISLHEDKIGSVEVIEHGTSNYEDAEYASSGQVMLKSQKSLSHKRKHNLRDGGYPKPRERSMSELMGNAVESPEDDNVTAKRLKGNDHSTNAKVSSSAPPVSKPSFKIGECIRRVANQLTGTLTLKPNNERDDISLQSEDANRGVAVDPTECSSLDELLSQLQQAAQGPLKEYSFLNIVVIFFSDFRNSIIQGQYSRTDPLPIDKGSGKRKKFPQSVGGFPEAFEFDDMNDAYWTDRVIQNGSEEPVTRTNKKKENQIVLFQPEKPLQENHCRSSRKQYSNANQPLAVEKPVEYVDKNAPAELIMNFSEGRSAPSETNLNKMFRRFGPIKEIETGVDRESGLARVMFKKASDAEVALSSAGIFNIFGPKIVVNYELNYSPTVPFKACSVPTIQDHHNEMQLDLSTHDHEMQLDFSTNGHGMQLDLSNQDMQLDLSAGDHDMQLDLSNFEV